MCEIAPEEKKTVRIRFPREDTELCFFNSPHMGEAYQEIQNLACLAEIKGRRLFIPGDARPDGELFRRAADWSAEIDCLAAPFPLVGLPSARKELSAALRIRQIMALHLPLPECYSPGLGWKRAARLQSDTGRSSQSSVCFWRGTELLL